MFLTSVSCSQTAWELQALKFLLLASKYRQALKSGSGYPATLAKIKNNMTGRASVVSYFKK